VAKSRDKPFWVDLKLVGLRVSGPDWENWLRDKDFSAQRTRSPGSLVAAQVVCLRPMPPPQLLPLTQVHKWRHCPVSRMPLVLPRQS
jgi:hypothetical protein